MKFVSSTYIVPESIEEKVYQTTILHQIKFNCNGILVMPTGSGKTIVLIRYIAELLKRGVTKFLIVAPKTVLVQQHFCTFLKYVTDVKIYLVQVHSPQRLAFLDEPQVIVISTPHIMANEIKHIGDFFEVIIFDEVHNVHENYPYYELLKLDNLKLGLTASVGTKTKLKKTLAYLKTKQVYKLEPYAYKPILTEEPHWLDLEPSNMHYSRILTTVITKYKKLIGLTPTNTCSYNLVEGLKRKRSYAAYFIGLKLIKLQHMLSLITTQPNLLIQEYLKKTKTTDLLIRTDIPVYGMYIEELRRIGLTTSVSLKIIRILEVINSASYTRCIVFAKYITTAKLIYTQLSKYHKVALLTGQNTKNKLKDQISEVDKLRDGTTNILVSTSAGYEGIDIPLANLVVVHEMSNSIIHYIQQKGRTARDCTPGRVIYIINRGTSDESYYLNNLQRTL